MRRSLPLFLAAAALLAACTSPAGDVLDGASSSSASSLTEILLDVTPSMDSASSASADAAASDAASSATAKEAASASANADAPAAAARVIEMTVDDWSFSPASITVKKGEKVIVRLTGVKGKHSFALQELGINVPVGPGETVDVEIPTDKEGTFSFRCRVPCGAGHKEMVGTLVVTA